MKYAVGKGVFIAVAGGNSFEDGNPKEVVADIASRVQGAVSVAAVDPNKAHAHYSTTGSYIELSAPGGTDRGFGRNGYVWQQTYDFNADRHLSAAAGVLLRRRASTCSTTSATSARRMATPHVAGVAAMLMQQGIKDPAAIEAALEKFATDLGDAGRDNTFGYGLIEARDTMRGLGLAK